MLSFLGKLADEVISKSGGEWISDPPACDYVRSLLITHFRARPIVEWRPYARSLDRYQSYDLILSLLEKAATADFSPSGGVIPYTPPCAATTEFSSSGGVTPHTPPCAATAEFSQNGGVTAYTPPLNGGVTPHTPPLNGGVTTYTPPLLHRRHAPPLAHQMAALDHKAQLNRALFESETFPTSPNPENSAVAAHGGDIDSIDNNIPFLCVASLSQYRRHAPPLRGVARHDEDEWVSDRKKDAACGGEAAACGCEPPGGGGGGDHWVNTPASDRVSAPDRSDLDQESDARGWEDDGGDHATVEPGAARQLSPIVHSDFDENLGFLNPELLLCIRFDIWHNRQPGPGISEWSIKLRSSGSRRDPDKMGVRDPMSVHNLYFANEPRRFRQNLTDYVKRGKLAPDAASRIAGQTMDLARSARVAILSQPIRGKYTRTPKGRSSRDQRYFPEHWAVLLLKDNTPSKLILHFGRDCAPILIDQFTRTADIREAQGQTIGDNAPVWLALYDPNKLYAEAKREDRALKHHLSQDKALRDYNPVTNLGRFVDRAYMSLYETNSWMLDKMNRIEAENNTLRSEVSELRSMVALLSKHPPSPPQSGSKPQAAAPPPPPVPL